MVGAVWCVVSEHLKSDDNACSPSALRCAPRVLLISETGEAPQHTAAEPSLAVLGPSQTRRMPGSADEQAGEKGEKEEKEEDGGKVVGSQRVSSLPLMKTNKA